MFKKICAIAIFSLLSISNFISASIEYAIHDIGTLQTKESQAIALNNQGQILGWYNIDGSNTGKHFFVRNRNGDFYELPGKEPSSGLPIDWQYLTDEGKAYGTFDTISSTRALCVWDQQNGIVKLGVLPGNDIVAINNAGQVLIKSILENENGKLVRFPIIWKNGQITKLKGLGGDLGIESEESYGFDMNNNGDVVGQSVVYLSYKNNLYKQIHATMWIDGQPIDLHDKMAKSLETIATAITDLREVLIEGMILRQDGSLLNIGYGVYCSKMTSKYICYRNYGIFDVLSNCMIHTGTVSYQLTKDRNSIWMQCIEISSINDNGEAIAQGMTSYGEKHALFLSPAGTH